MRLFEGDIKTDILNSTFQCPRNILTPKQFSYHTPIKSYKQFNLKLPDHFEYKLLRYGQAKLLICTQTY